MKFFKDSRKRHYPRLHFLFVVVTLLITLNNLNYIQSVNGLESIPIPDSMSEILPNPVVPGMTDGISGIKEKFSNSIADIYKFFDTVKEYKNTVSPQCVTALTKLRENSEKTIQANMASGRVIEVFGLLSQIQKKPELVSSLVYGHLNSMGDPDACEFIEDYQYCYADIIPGAVKVGWCMPNECKGEDIDNVIAKLTSGASLAPSANGDGAALAVPGMNNLSVNCGYKKYPISTGTIIMYILISIISLIVIIGTYMDRPSIRRKQEQLKSLYNNSNDRERSYNHQLRNEINDSNSITAKDDDLHKEDCLAVFVKCFSLYKNMNLLMAPNRGGPFDSLDGIRVFSMLWVIFGHTFVFALISPGFSNADLVLPNNGKGFIERYTAMAVPGGFYAVDTFFFMSGFLGCYFMLKKLSTSGIPKNPLWVAVLYIQRWIRLTPTYMFLVCCNLFLMIRWGSGPFWNGFDVEIQNCADYWWTNILYINNIVTAEGGMSCYAVSWYLANDFQFFLALPFFVLIALKFNKYIGMLVPMSICIASWVVYYIRAYENNWGVSLFGSSFKDYYINPFSRCPTYLIGVMLAMVWFFYLEEKRNIYVRMLKTERAKYNSLIFIGFLISFVLMGITVYGQRDAYITLPGAPSVWSRSEMSAFVAWAKSGWTIGLAIFSTLMFFGEGGPIKSFLECRLFTILARVCFCCYLVHPMVLTWYYSQQVHPFHFTNFWYAYNFSSAVFLTFAVATVVHLFLERPLANLERLSRNSTPSKKSNNSRTLQYQPQNASASIASTHSHERNTEEELMAPLLAGSEGSHGKELV